MVVLLQALLRLCDEGAGALQTLATVGDLLRQLAQFHHLRTQKRRSGSHPKAVFSSVCSFVLISLSCKYKTGWRSPNPTYLALFPRTTTRKQTREYWTECFGFRSKDQPAKETLWKYVKLIMFQKQRTAGITPLPPNLQSPVWITYRPSSNCRDNNHQQLNCRPSNISNMQSMKFQT